MTHELITSEHYASAVQFHYLRRVHDLSQNLKVHVEVLRTTCQPRIHVPSR